MFYNLKALFNKHFIHYSNLFTPFAKACTPVPIVVPRAVPTPGTIEPIAAPIGAAAFEATETTGLIT